MTERTTISVPEAAVEAAREHKGDRTWAEVLRDGAHAPGARHGDDGGDTQAASQPDPLTAEDIGLLADEVAAEVENRLTRR